MSEACARFPDPERALRVLNVLETMRLEARLAHALPGLSRQMAALRGGEGPDPRCSQLLEPAATVHDSIVLLGVVYDRPPEMRSPYMGVLEPGHAAAARRARLTQEKDKLKAALARLLEAQDGTPEQAENARFSLELAGRYRPTGFPSTSSS